MNNLMNVHTGSVDTEENWLAEARDAIANGKYLEWVGYVADDYDSYEQYEDLCDEEHDGKYENYTDQNILDDVCDFLIDVELDKDGDWVAI